MGGGGVEKTCETSSSEVLRSGLPSCALIDVSRVRHVGPEPCFSGAEGVRRAVFVRRDLRRYRCVNGSPASVPPSFPCARTLNVDAVIDAAFIGRENGRESALWRRSSPDVAAGSCC